VEQPYVWSLFFGVRRKGLTASSAPGSGGVLVRGQIVVGLQLGLQQPDASDLFGIACDLGSAQVLYQDLPQFDYHRRGWSGIVLPYYCSQDAVDEIAYAFLGSNFIEGVADRFVDHDVERNFPPLAVPACLC
jgi:hypothetical protein